MNKKLELSREEINLLLKGMYEVELRDNIKAGYEGKRLHQEEKTTNMINKLIDLKNNNFIKHQKEWIESLH